MEDFPKLAFNEVALMRADVYTGHILDEEFNLVLDNAQSVYTIFHDIKLAQEYAEYTLSIRKNVEFIVYGKDNEVILYLRPKI